MEQGSGDSQGSRAHRQACLLLQAHALIGQQGGVAAIDRLRQLQEFALQLHSHTAYVSLPACREQATGGISSCIPS